MSGVTTILVIRTQLWLTNYPQLGGHGLHIAHLLWGGLFMLVAIGLLLTFLGRRIRAHGRRRSAASASASSSTSSASSSPRTTTTSTGRPRRSSTSSSSGSSCSRAPSSGGGRWSRGTSSPTRSTCWARRRRTTSTRRSAPGRWRCSREADPADPLVAPLRSVFGAWPRGPWRPRGGSPAGVRALATGSGASRPGAASPRSSPGCSSSGRRCRCSVSWSSCWPSASTSRALIPATCRTGSAICASSTSPASSPASSRRPSSAPACSSCGGNAAADACRLFERALLVAILFTQVFAFVESQFGAVFGLAVDLVLLACLRAVAADLAPAAPAAGGGPRRVAAPVPLAAG